MCSAVWSALAIARGRADLKDTNKWQRGITPDCWTDYHCFKIFMACFLRASSLCELGCWLPYNHNAVQLWVFPVLEAGMFLTATIQLQASVWGTTITLGCFLGSARHHACHPVGILVISSPGHSSSTQLLCSQEIRKWRRWGDIITPMQARQGLPD